jgi:hypothetical protein
LCPSAGGPLPAARSLVAPKRTRLRLCQGLLLLLLPWVAAGMLLPASGMAQPDTGLEPHPPFLLLRRLLLALARHTGSCQPAGGSPHRTSMVAADWWVRLLLSHRHEGLLRLFASGCCRLVYQLLAQGPGMLWLRHCQCCPASSDSNIKRQVWSAMSRCCM